MNFAIQHPDPSRRLVGFAFVGGLHLLLIYALVSGLAHSFIEPARPVIDATVLPHPVDRHDPPPPVDNRVPVDRTDTNWHVVTPDIDIRIDDAPPAVRSEPPQVSEAPAVPHVPVRVGPVIDAARDCPLPEYPAASRRQGETGTVQIRFFVDERGRAVRSEVIKSSGFRRLDEAAQAALGQCAFKAGTVDGRAVQSQADIAYVWTLR
jgi:periplasmic protein TonB